VCGGREAEDAAGLVGRLGLDDGAFRSDRAAFRMEVVNWGWDYFGKSRGPQVLDRSEAARIDWEEDAAPVDMLASLFEARGWPYEFAGEDEISGEVQGSWACYQLRGIWRPEDHVLQLICLPDIRVPDDKRDWPNRGWF